MPMISVMTELEAVNEMLMSIGQAPVDTLTVIGIKDVSIPRARLSSMARRVLSRGFNFSTDDAYPLTPDSDGIILIPDGALKVQGSGPQDDYTIRRHSKGLALYNKTERIR